MSAVPRAAFAALALALSAGARAAPPDGPADATPAAPARPAARSRAASLPAANFLVEWRIRPAAVASGRGDVVVTSNSAATGGGGDGTGAVVVGTARPAPPQSLRVANGREGAMRFDQSTTRTVYDMSYAAESSAESSAGTAPAASGAGGTSRSRSRSSDRGAAGHEVVVHRVDGLRVTPRWTQGDSLELDIQLTHGAPAPGADAGATREFEFTSTVRLSFDEWQSVATVGDGADELQVRVTWR